MKYTLRIHRPHPLECSKMVGALCLPELSLYFLIKILAGVMLHLEVRKVFKHICRTNPHPTNPRPRLYPKRPEQLSTALHLRSTKIPFSYKFWTLAGRMEDCLVRHSSPSFRFPNKSPVCMIRLKLLFSLWMAQAAYLPSRITLYGRGSLK